MPFYNALTVKTNISHKQQNTYLVNYILETVEIIHHILSAYLTKHRYYLK